MRCLRRNLMIMDPDQEHEIAELRRENSELVSYTRELRRRLEKPSGRTQVVMIVLLLWGAFHPYNGKGFYSLLDFVCFGGFGRLIWKFGELKIDFESGVKWGIVMLLLYVGAFLFLPILDLAIKRSTWFWIDLFFAGFLLYTVRAFNDHFAKSHPKRNN